MKLIGMPEASRRLGVSPHSVQRALTNAGVPLQQINAKAWAVDESDLEKFIVERERVGYSGRGRPAKREADIPPA